MNNNLYFYNIIAPALSLAESNTTLAMNTVVSSLDPGVGSGDETMNTEIEANVTCADGFYSSNQSSACRPLCSRWVEPPENDITQKITMASVIIGLVTAIVFILIALTFYRSEMYDIHVTDNHVHINYCYTDCPSQILHTVFLHYYDFQL